MRYIKYFSFPLVLAVCACSGQPDTPAVKAPKAEDIISLHAHAVGCFSRDDFHEWVRHAVSGEKTKMQAMLDGLECMPLPTTEKYKVLQVDRGAMEIVNSTSDKTDGIWTFIESAV